MSAAKRQKTCACCGAPFTDSDRTEVETFIDGDIRYVAVHPGHSTFPARRRQRARPDLPEAA
jgi:hypothetical protein